MRQPYIALLLVLLTAHANAQTSPPAGSPANDKAERLGGTEPLTTEGDLAAQMVAGIDRHLMKLIDASEALRTERTRQPGWARGPGPRALQRLIGTFDLRSAARPTMQLVATVETSARVAETDAYTVDAVRWPVLDEMDAEGLLLRPKSRPVAGVVAIPDADWTPEMLVGLAPGVPPEAQFARRLAENGCVVLVPTLIDRAATWSGNPKYGMTAQSHREYIYRMAYELGRHIIGYEVRKVTAGAAWFEWTDLLGPAPPVGVAGYGEGGLLALHAAAVDSNFDAALVSGYFQPRQGVWSEPIYRNVWGLLTEFGDAEVAGLIAPRTLIVEAARGPEIDGPPPAAGDRRPGSPGALKSPSIGSVRHEFERARWHYEQCEAADQLQLIVPEEGDAGPGSERALAAFLAALGRKGPLAPPGSPPTDLRGTYDPTPRLKRQFDQLVDYNQRLVSRLEDGRRQAMSILKLDSVELLERFNLQRRAYLWNEIIGRCEGLEGSRAVRSRLWKEQPKWTGYEVQLDLGPDVFAYGILLLPKDLQPGQRRPVVVCQHGLEGRPQQVCDPAIESSYHAFGAKLADLGYIVYAPQNPYIGGDAFRVLQRKANPLGLSLFSFIIAQHERTLEWLSTLPQVDPERIAFYGLSYGGKTAMRVPAVLTQYCLSICSGDFNEWIRKNVSPDYPNSFLFTSEYEMPEFDLAERFGYAEMASLIAPRPFMVERGHFDGVALDEWVAYEYAKVRRLYAQLGIPERTEIEYFPGPHEIHAVGTFEFLRKHLGWPRR